MASERSKGWRLNSACTGRMVREAIGSAVPKPRKEAKREKAKMAPVIPWIEGILEADQRARHTRPGGACARRFRHAQPPPKVDPQFPTTPEYDYCYDGGDMRELDRDKPTREELTLAQKGGRRVNAPGLLLLAGDTAPGAVMVVWRNLQPSL